MPPSLVYGAPAPTKFGSRCKLLDPTQLWLQKGWHIAIKGWRAWFHSVRLSSGHWEEALSLQHARQLSLAHGQHACSVRLAPSSTHLELHAQRSVEQRLQGTKMLASAGAAVMTALGSARALCRKALWTNRCLVLARRGSVRLVRPSKCILVPLKVPADPLNQGYG